MVSRGPFWLLFPLVLSLGCRTSSSDSKGFPSSGSARFVPNPASTGPRKEAPPPPRTPRPDAPLDRPDPASGPETTTDRLSPTNPKASKSSLSKLVGRAFATTEPAILLLGVRKSPMPSYYSTIDDETNSGESDDYETLVLVYEKDQVRLAGTLPLLAIPGATRFEFLGGSSLSAGAADFKAQGAAESEAAQTSGDDAAERELRIEARKEAPWYFGSRLYKADSLSDAARARKKILAELRSERAPGIFSAESLRYVTPRARCVQTSEGRYVGGAHYVSGHEETHLFFTDAARSERAADYLGAERFRETARALLTSYEGADASEPQFGSEQQLGWSSVRWDRDVRLCLERHEGIVEATASITLNTMSSRSTVWSVPLGRAYEEFGVLPGPSRPSPERVREFVPGAIDVAMAPGQQVLVVQTAEELVAFAPLATEYRDWEDGSRELSRIRRPFGSIVMEEWGTGRAVERWLRQLGLEKEQNPAENASI